MEKYRPQIVFSVGYILMAIIMYFVFEPPEEDIVKVKYICFHFLAFGFSHLLLSLRKD